MVTIPEVPSLPQINHRARQVDDFAAGRAFTIAFIIRPHNMDLNIPGLEDFVRNRVASHLQKREVSGILEHLTTEVLTKPQMALVQSYFRATFKCLECFSRRKTCLDDRELKARTINH